MEKKSEKYLKQFSEIGEEILNTLLSTLKERGIKSINVYDYWNERGTDWYYFFDTDKDGYGVALFVGKLYVTDDGIELKMLDSNECEWTDWDESNLTAIERCYLLEMIEQILELADEQDDGRVLNADETFEDWGRNNLLPFKIILETKN